MVNFKKNQFIIFGLVGVFLLIIFGGIWYISSLSSHTKITNDVRKEVKTISQERIDDYTIALRNDKRKDITPFEKQIIPAIKNLDEGKPQQAAIALETAVVSQEKKLGAAAKKDISLVSTKILLSESYLQTGNATHKEKEYAQKALEILDWLPDYSKTFIAVFQRGYAYEIMQNYSEALKFYAQADALATNEKHHALIINQVGHVQDLQGKTQEACSAYGKAFAIDPTNSKININLGRCMARNKDITRAIIYFEYGVKTTNNRLLQAEVYANMAAIAMYLPKISKEEADKKVFDYAKKAVEASSAFPWAHVVYSQALSTQKKYSEAEVEAKKAIALNADLTYAYEALGNAQEYSGKLDDAIVSYAKMLSVAKKDIVLMADAVESNEGKARLYLSVIYAKKKDVKNASAYLQQIIDIPNTIALYLAAQQFKKENYGLFSSLKWDKDFETYLKKAKFIQ